MNIPKSTQIETLKRLKEYRNDLLDLSIKTREKKRKVELLIRKLEKVNKL